MSLNIDKQELRTYLLGTLAEDRRAILEESILCDPGVYEELLIIEAELIDQYVANNLSPSERNQFETHFLITAERQKNLRFGRLLKRYLASQSGIVPAEDVPAGGGEIDKSAPAKKFFPFVGGTFASGTSAAVSAAVVAGIALIVALCWQLLREPEQHVVRQDASRGVSVRLMPGSLRSEGGVMQRVQVTPKDVNVKLEMQLRSVIFENYKSELLRENKSVQSADKLKMETSGEEHIVPWTITGDVLSPGDYQVRLSGVLDSGQDEFIDSYSFRVIE